MSTAADWTELQRVELLLSAHRYAEALGRARVLAAAAPGVPEPQLLIARSELGLGNHAGAEQAAGAAVALAPANPQGHVLMAVAATQAACHDPRTLRRPTAARAVAAAREALRLDPARALHWRTFAEACLADGRVREAIPAADEAVRLEPLIWWSWYCRARVARAARDLRVAEASAREALRLEPDSAAASTELGVILARSGRRSDSMRQLEVAAALDPADPAARRVMIAYGSHQLYLAVLLLFCPLVIVGPGYLFVARFAVSGLMRWSVTRPTAERLAIASARRTARRGGSRWLERRAGRRAVSARTPIRRRRSIVVIPLALLVAILLVDMVGVALGHAPPPARVASGAVLAVAVVAGVLLVRVRARRGRAGSGGSGPLGAAD